MKYRANLSVQSPTRKKVNGKEYLVLPTVAVQEQVLNGELLPAEEIERNLMLWNAVPVTWNHPTVNNQQTTIRKANYHEWAVGQFLNVDMVEDKMRGESWIEIETAEQKEQGEEILNEAESGEMLEVSTGYFADTIDEQGEFEGEKYNAIQQNIIPDHLALLPNAEGACSVEDGCGTGRTNCQESELKTNASMPSYSGTEDTSWSEVDKTYNAFQEALDLPDETWDELNGDQQDEIRKHHIDQSGENFSELGYPVVNPSTNDLNRGAVANAKARASQENNNQVLSVANELWNEEFEEESENNNVEVDGMENNGFESFAKHLQDFFQSESDECEANEDIENEAEEAQESEGVSEDMAENEAEEETAEPVENEQDEQEEEKACIENVAEAHDLEANEVEDAIESYKERLQEQEEKRDELVEELNENEDCKLNEDDLEGMEFDQLEKLQESFNSEEQEEHVDYSGKNVNSNEQETEGVPEMPSVQSD